jgi:anthranilate phosphoribosyltransferase
MTMDIEKNMNETELRSFGALVQRLINGISISREESRIAFGQILRNHQPELQQGAFLAALAAKGETAEEIAGVWEAVMECDTIKAEITPDNAPLIENSGTGMDSLKTFNVSSAAGIVASACGAKMARHGARALTSKRGTVDILEKVGVDMECDISTVARSVEKAGIGLFNGMSPQIHPGGLGRILSQIRFGSTLNIAASLANPARPTIGLRGLHSERMLDLAVDVMKEIGYDGAIIAHGKDDEREGGMDEISITGKTMIRSFGVADLNVEELRPEDAGLKTAKFEDVAALDDDTDAANRFLQTLAGKANEACVDFTCLNASAVLLAGGMVKSLSEGVVRSREAIESGAAIGKLRDWVSAQTRNPQSAIDLLQRSLENAGVAG